jgi:DNA transformation protein
LYFVVDEQTRPQYEQAGMHNFAYDNKKGRIQVKRYYAVPEEVLADTDTLQAWARTAI